MKQNIILRTKILPPQLKKNIINRNRLIKALKENLDKKLILINAGAGYGKTTLISQLLSAVNISNMFYLLESTDAELSVFFSYLVAGIRKVYPEFGSRTENLLNAIKNPNQYLEMIGGTFINEIVEMIPDDFIIILDDYQTIIHSQQTAHALNYFFSHAPPSLHFIIASREMPNFLISPLKSKNDFFELTNRDLKFSHEEIRELFRDIYAIHPTEEEVKKIEKHSEGWVTSLQLMLQLKENVADIMKSHDILSDMKSYHEWQRDYFNFFAQEIYDREPLTIQQFMVDCSVIELSNEGVCTALTKRRDAGTILQDLEKRNTFLFRTPDNNYRFHNLFREFLLSKLRDPKRKKRIFLSAAQYFSKTRQQEYAADYYLEAGYYKEVAKIIRKIGCDLTNRGKSNTVCAYIEKLPMKMVNQEPDLLMVYGYALMLNGYPNEAAKNLRRAAKILQKQPRSSDKCSRVFYELASIHFITGNDRLAMKWLKKALAVRPKKKEITYVDILNSLGILYSRMGVKKFGDAIDYFKKALQIVKKLPENRDVEATIYNNWAMTEQKAGNLNAANELSFKAIKILKKEEYFAAQSGITFSSAAWLSLHLGDVDRAYSVLELGSHISKKYNDIYSLAMLWQGYAWYYEALCDFHQAKACLKKTIDFFEEMKFKKLTQRAYRDLCLINIRLGLLAEAEHSLSKSWAIKKTRDDAQAVPLLLAEARLRIAQNRASHAENILTYSLKLANKYGKVLERFYILLDLAMVLHKKRRTAETINVLNQALDVSKEKGYEYLLARTMKQQQWMIELLLRTDKKYVFSVLQQSSIPYHLVEVSLFGRPRVTVDGMKIDPGLWQTSKAMKLFCYLCLSKEKTLSRDTLIDSLWKDTPLHKSSKSLRKAVHNIRKAFKSVTVTEDSPVIYKDGLYKISSNFSVRVDVEEFIRAVKQAKDVEHDYKALKAQIKGVTHLYQDGMAKGWFDEWVDEMRAHYSHVYEEYLLMFVYHSIKNNDYKESVVWLQKLIENNFFEEEYHRKLWAAYARLKKYKEIREDFLNLKERFKSELKDKLQPETIELYNFLVK